jgi:hypothetical protein
MGLRLELNPDWKREDAKPQSTETAVMNDRYFPS